MMRDLVIVGAGPAGITAAVYAARKKLDFVVITKDIGGQAALSSDIQNYTGYQFITGPELAFKFREHLSNFSFELREGEEVKKVEKEASYFLTTTGSGDKVLSKTIIIASGKRPRLLGVPGEREYKNRGVTYCATCDAPLFAGKVVAVIGGGNAALDAVLQLIKIASKVYLININPTLGGDPIMREK
ncbi:MAG: NAD(P)/FAD-dependent oxidoreductase, partial [Candidatus Margulisiibacteriota bacterium]